MAAADAYRTTGSRAAMRCATTQILTLAKEGALTGKMSSGQAYYVQGWVGGAIAIAWLKTRDASAASPQDTELIVRWLKTIGDSTSGYYSPRLGKRDAANNHLYWAGVELAAIGVVANDRSDFDWAMRAYDLGVNMIRPDGSLPLEMARGSRALHDHLYALAPLVLVAEFGEANGIDSYAHAKGSIHLLVKFCLAGLQNPQIVEKITGLHQEVSSHPTGEQLGWAPPYLRRFSNPVLDQMVVSVIFWPPCFAVVQGSSSTRDGSYGHGGLGWKLEPRLGKALLGIGGSGL